MKEQGTIRLADKILSGQIKPGLPFAGSKQTPYIWNLCQQVMQQLGEVEVIVADDIPPYMYLSDAYEKGKRWGLADFPNVVSPFSQVFVEFKTPHMRPYVAAAGILVKCFQFNTLTDADNFGSQVISAVLAKLSMDQRLKFSDSHIWIQHGIVVVERDGAWSPMAQFSLMGDKNGVPMNEVALTSISNFANEDILESIGIDIVFPALMAFSFLHCKNIKLAPQEPNPKLSKAFQRRHGRPLLRYHTLEIEPMKKVLETEGGASHNGLKKALHICRGHFATYTPDKPLFGKFTGTVWKTPHVRGNASEGIVAKDYKVKI